jgi:hypothetical protein
MENCDQYDYCGGFTTVNDTLNDSVTSDDWWIVIHTQDRNNQFSLIQFFDAQPTYTRLSWQEVLIFRKLPSRGHAKPARKKKKTPHCLHCVHCFCLKCFFYVELLEAGNHTQCNIMSTAHTLALFSFLGFVTEHELTWHLLLVIFGNQCYVYEYNLGSNSLSDFEDFPHFNSFQTWMSVFYLHNFFRIPLMMLTGKSLSGNIFPFWMRYSARALRSTMSWMWSVSILYYITDLWMNCISVCSTAPILLLYPTIHFSFASGTFQYSQFHLNEGWKAFLHHAVTQFHGPVWITGHCTSQGKSFYDRGDVSFRCLILYHRKWSQ